MFRSTPSWLATPSDSLRYLVYCRVYAAATVVRLTLPDALDDDRLAISAVHWAGALVLAITGSLTGWVLCAVAIVLSLLLGEDQLTQSVYLLACAIAGIVAIGLGSIGPGRRDGSIAAGLSLSVRLLTAGTYGIAVFHKLNRDFFDPDVSCAAAGVEILGDNWDLSFLEAGAGGGYWPVVFVATEVAVVALLLYRPLFGMLLALAMHIPLTIVFAPSFAFVMISGWVCFFRDEDLRALAAALRKHKYLVGGLGFGLGLLSFVLYMQRHDQVYPFWSFKEALLWVGAVWLVVAWWTSRDTIGGRCAWSDATPRRVRIPSLAIGALFVLNGLLPYTGLRFHHSGAMLSNLRIDEGCWNSYVVPESVRLTEPYIRIDEVEVVAGDVTRARQAELKEALWNRAALRRAGERLCRNGARVVVGGDAGGTRFDGVELCEGRWSFGEPLLPNARPFQENLDRECPQACIH